MKVKKIVIALALVLSIGAASSIANDKTNTVQAKASSAVFPKKMRGSWYHFDQYTKTIKKEKWTKNKIIYYTNGKISTLNLHKRPTTTPKYSEKTSNWIYIFGPAAKVHGYKWITVYGWDQSAGAGAHYTVAKLNGHQVLTNAGGAGFWSSEHWYKSRKLANQLKNRRYAHFVYDIN